jgi:hypothetical protein
MLRIQHIGTKDDNNLKIHRREYGASHDEALFDTYDTFPLATKLQHGKQCRSYI